MRTAQDAAVDLLNAVDEALNIFTVQAQQANASMETAMASRDRLMSFLAAFQPGDHDSGRPQPSTKPADPAVGGLSAEERFAESSARSKKWVTAQSEIWIALMRLYPYPEARDELERLAQRMLLIQALQVAEPIPGPRYVPPTFDLSTSLVE